MDEKMITLSHTSLKTFYQCRFKYYAQYVLGLSDDQDNFFIKYGRYAHQIIEIHDRRLEEGQPFDFDDVSSEIFKDYDFSPKEKTLLNHLHEDLRRLLDFNDEHRATMNSPTSIVESRYRYELDEKTSIIGRIDKIVMTRKDDKQYVSIIDYKTNDEAFDKSKLPYGYSMQLPLYSLLVANDPSFTDAQIIGYYIQNIAPKDFLKKPGQTIDQLYQRQLRLNGLSIDDIGVLSSFDGSLLDNSSSRFIKSLALKSDGGFRYPKRVADYDKFEQYKSTVLEHARSASSAIRTNDFTINPKQLGKTDYSCKYCPFRDLCFRPDRAVEFIKLDDEEDSDEPELE
jgi:ATP-dependent helicase/nuclease subunit B